MPRIPKQVKPSYRATKTKPNGSNYKFYNSKRWRNYSKRYRTVCEVCKEDGVYTDVTTSAKDRGVVDHIVPIERGGAKWDEFNHMGMCQHHHDSKRGLESHGYVVATMRGRDGLIPVNRMDIVHKLLRLN